MNSVFGGHGIQSGGVAIVGSPMQEAAGFADTPDQAYADWMEWTVDGNPQWTRFYVENSRAMLYDWLTSLGVRFDRIRPSHGNSIPRFHMTHRRGLNLTRPIFLEALRYSNIDFRWNSVAEHLVKEDGRVVGVEGRDYRAASSSRRVGFRAISRWSRRTGEATCRRRARFTACRAITRVAAGIVWPKRQVRR